MANFMKKCLKINDFLRKIEKKSTFLGATGATRAKISMPGLKIFWNTQNGKAKFFFAQKITRKSIRASGKTMKKDGDLSPSQTVDKAGAGDNLQHHFSIKNNFSFISRKIV